MGHDTVNAVLLEGVVCGKPLKPDSYTAWYSPSGKCFFKSQRASLRRLAAGASLCNPTRSAHRSPKFCMHINSDVNLLSFEGNFVSLHIGTVLIVCHLSFALQIYNPIIIVPTFSLQTMKTPRWFAMRTEARSLRRAASDLSQCVSLCKHSNL